jgi:hypothetical protein
MCSSPESISFHQSQSFYSSFRKKAPERAHVVARGLLSRRAEGAAKTSSLPQPNTGTKPDFKKPGATPCCQEHGAAPNSRLPQAESIPFMRPSPMDNWRATS